MFTLVTARIIKITVSPYFMVYSKYLIYTIYQYCIIVSMIPLIRLLGVCGVQGIVGLGSHGMRTRCHLLTFTFYLFIYYNLGFLSSLMSSRRNHQKHKSRMSNSFKIRRKSRSKRRFTNLKGKVG